MDTLRGIEFAEGVEELEKDLPTLKKYYGVAAKAMREYFNALVKEDFTEEQALEIVIAHGYSPESSSIGKYEGSTRVPDDEYEDPGEDEQD